MADSTLSQDEIDALLQGAGVGQAQPAAPAAPSAPAQPVTPAASTEISPADIETFSNNMRESLKKVSVTLGILLGGKDVQIKDFKPNFADVQELKAGLPESGVMVKQDITGEASGVMAIIYNMDIAKYLIDLLLGGTGANPPAALDESHLAAARELTDQIFPGMSGDIMEKYGKKMNLAPTVTTVFNSPEELQISDFTDSILRVDLVINVENGAKEGNVFLLVNNSFLNALLAKKKEEEASIPSAASAPAAGAQISRQTVAPPPPQYGSPQQDVRPVSFGSLEQTPVQGMSGNINLLLDVPMEITVELGRSRKLVKDILALSQGAIIELDKMAGEAVDLLVNGKLIARGEVVVVGEENFGVRVTEIVSPYDRINSLK